MQPNLEIYFYEYRYIFEPLICSIPAQVILYLLHLSLAATRNCDAHNIETINHAEYTHNNTVAATGSIYFASSTSSPKCIHQTQNSKRGNISQNIHSTATSGVIRDPSVLVSNPFNILLPSISGLSFFSQINSARNISSSILSYQAHGVQIYIVLHNLRCRHHKNSRAATNTTTAQTAPTHPHSPGLDHNRARHPLLPRPRIPLPRLANHRSGRPIAQGNGRILGHPILIFHLDVASEIVFGKRG